MELFADWLVLNPEEGALYWRHDVAERHGAHMTCGGKRVTGRCWVVIQGKQYNPRRVAWVLEHGAEPIGCVTALNRDLLDLRPSNLIDMGATRQPAARFTKEDLTADEAREVFEYNPDTGALTWREARFNPQGRLTAQAGALVGGLTREYRTVSFRPRAAGKPYTYQVHRLCWLWMTGEWPPHEVDHRNGDKADNRWQNLRHADDELNAQNRRRANRNNKSTGLLGVTTEKRSPKFIARIGHKRKLSEIGRFDTAEEAHQAYLDAKRRLHAGGTL